MLKTHNSSMSCISGWDILHEPTYVARVLQGGHFHIWQCPHTRAMWAAAGPAAAICLGCLEIWEPNPCHNSSQGSRLPPSCTNGPSEPRQQMTQKQGESAATPKQCGHPAEELMFIFILSQPCQHENKQYLFRVSSKHLLSQTNEFFFLIAKENNQKYKILSLL